LGEGGLALPFPGVLSLREALADLAAVQPPAVGLALAPRHQYDRLPRWPPAASGQVDPQPDALLHLAGEQEPDVLGGNVPDLRRPPTQLADGVGAAQSDDSLGQAHRDPALGWGGRVPVGQQGEQFLRADLADEGAPHQPLAVCPDHQADHPG